MLKFSVLMSVYCKEKSEFLKLALQSVLDQTVKPSEIVIIKDGKLTEELDNTISAFVKKNEELFTVVQLEKNEGLGIALAKGVELCKYDLIARMDSDDISKNNRFEKQIKVFEENPDVDVVGSCIDEFYEDYDKCISKRNVPENHVDIINYAKSRNPFNHMTVMFKKKSVLNAGNYLPFMWNEDYFLWVRMILNDSKLFNIQESLVYARTGDEMFARRGGMRYAIQDVKLQKEFYSLGFVNNIEFLINSLRRSAVRLLPNRLRKNLYLKLLRK